MVEEEEQEGEKEGEELEVKLKCSQGGGRRKRWAENKKLDSTTELLKMPKHVHHYYYHSRQTLTCAHLS